MPRKSRNKVNKEQKKDFSKPLDVYKLGSEEDPCFGKLHDLKAEECQECGDSEFCVIVMAQNLHKKRIDIEAQQKFLDIEESDIKQTTDKKKAKELCLKYRDQGYKRLKTILKVSKMTGLSKDIVKEIYNNL